MSFIETYEYIVRTYPIYSGFVKFAILATAGEVAAYRIRMNSWPKREFGLIPKALVWGVLGIFILFAFRIFSKGVPQLCGPLLPLGSSETLNTVLTAFYISLFMNIIFAPVMMLIHRLTDIKIESGKGRLSALFTSSPGVDELFRAVAWERMWGFVYKKTIPFFWVPAHTITFLLPPAWRILFAAVLSVALGVLLACADDGPRSPEAHST